jgi:hypothetical protein
MIFETGQSPFVTVIYELKVTFVAAGFGLQKLSLNGHRSSEPPWRAGSRPLNCCYAEISATIGPSVPMAWKR